MDYAYFLQYDYAIINPLQVSPECYQDLAPVRLLLSPLRHHYRMLPMLVSFREMATYPRMMLWDRSNDWLTQYDHAMFSALLRSDAPMNHMRSHLQFVMPHWHSPLKKQVWLRFHDPRVFSHLSWILEPAELAWLMGPILQWGWYDPVRQSWEERERPDAGTLDQSPIFTAQQWSQLDLLESLNLCLRDLSRGGASWPVNTQSVMGVMHELEQAVEAGLPAPEDWQLYARLSWLYGPAVHRTAVMEACLRQAVREGQSYVSLYHRQARQVLMAEKSGV